MTYFSPKKAIKPKFVREPGILSHSEIKLGKSAMNDKRLLSPLKCFSGLLFLLFSFFLLLLAFFVFGLFTYE